MSKKNTLDLIFVEEERRHSFAEDGGVDIPSVTANALSKSILKQVKVPFSKVGNNLGEIFAAGNGFTVLPLDGDVSQRNKLADRAIPCIVVSDEPRSVISSCTENCEDDRPSPCLFFPDTEPEEKFSVIVSINDDNRWAFEEKPLYFWASDESRNLAEKARVVPSIITP